MKEEPRLLMTWMGLTLCMTWITLGANDPSKPADVHAQRTVIAELGPEHMANAVFRRGVEGDRIAAWGDRILQWEAKPAATVTEVVPRKKNLTGYSNGGCAMDLRADGIDEVIVARVMQDRSGSDLLWFEEMPGQRLWQEHLIAHLEHERLGAPHDIVPFHMPGASGPSLRGVAAVIARQRLVWFEMPKDVTAPWTQHPIATLPGKNQSGMVVGDIAGRGRPDLVCGMFWVECPADPASGSWKPHRFGTWDTNGWGGMTKHGLGDMDGDGRLDIVAAEAEIPDSRLAVFCRKTKNSDDGWESHPIDSGLYCPHSLVLADVNADGRLDVLIGEMTAGGWSFPLNPKPRLLLYVNDGHLRFTRHVLDTGWGVHEMRLAPPRPNGQLLLYAVDEIQLFKFKDMTTHVVSWTIGP